MAERTAVKEVRNCVLYSDNTLLIKGVRASYPHVLIPKGGTDAKGQPIDPAFSITALMPKAEYRAAKDLIKGVIDKILADNKVKNIKADAKFLRDGDLAGKEDYEGHYTVSAREQAERPPSVRDADGRTKLTRQDSSKIYGGCFVNLLIRPWYQDNKFGKRVNAGLSAVQFLRDGEPFGEGRITEGQIDDTFNDEASGWDDDEADGL